MRAGAMMLAGLGAAATMAAGCLAPRQTLAVAVRDARTGAPVAGIAVKVTTQNPQHAMRVTDYTRALAGGPEADEPFVRTGPDGAAAVLAPTDRPFYVAFILPGMVPETLPFRENGRGNMRFEATDWIDLPVRPAGNEPAEVQVRIAPAGDVPRS